MIEPKHKIFHPSAFKAIVDLAKKEKKEVYLVGGFLRDLALGHKKTSLDLDFCLKTGAVAFGRKISKKLKAGFVVLDQARG